MLKNILIATDFSSAAEAATAWGVAIAQPNDAEIYLLHVLYLPNLMSPDIAPPPDLGRELEEGASIRLDETATRLRDSGAQITPLLVPGVPSRMIKETAAERSCELIVMGTQGLTGLRHLLLGSTAERVIQHAPCPVLAVHDGDLPKEGPLRRIVLPTDFSRDAEVAADTTLELLRSQQQESKVLLVHAYQLPFEYTAYGTVPTSWNYLQDVGGAAKEELEKRAQALRLKGWEVETKAVEGAPAAVVTEEAEGSQADLIAMGTHGRSGLGHLLLGSTAERVIQRAHCPVLVIQRNDE